LQFSTANDSPNHNPITVTLEDSNKTVIDNLHMGSNWTLIYNGSTGISADAEPSRFTYGTQTMAFISYLLLITSQRGSDLDVQHSEACLLS
jgi:hypothetical protein